VHTVRISVQELDNGEDEIVGLVERVEDFVFGDIDRCGARDAALYLEEP